MSNLQRALRSIGKTNFVEFFLDYKELALKKDKLTVVEKIPLARKLLNENKNASKLSGQMIRINYAIIIFKNGWEDDALREVINSKSSIITDEIKKSARELLRK